MKIDLLGTSFAVQSDEDPEYLSSIIRYLSEKIEEVRRSVKTNDDLKVGILAALLICDELFKTRAESPIHKHSLSSDEEIEVSEITQRLIRQIDECLPAE